MLEFLSRFIFGTYDLITSILCAVLGMTAFGAYLFGCYQKFGFTQSISITYYLWEKAEHELKISHNLRWIFQLFMFFSALMIVMISQTFWYLIVGILFVLMAFFPSVLYKDYIYPHCFFATSAIVLGLVGLPVIYGWMWIVFPIIAFIGDIIIYIFDKQVACNNEKETTKLYWIEVWSLLSMIAGLVFSIISKM